MTKLVNTGVPGSTLNKLLLNVTNDPLRLTLTAVTVVGLMIRMTPSVRFPTSTVVLWVDGSSSKRLSLVFSRLEEIVMLTGTSLSGFRKKLTWVWFWYWIG